MYFLSTRRRSLAGRVHAAKEEYCAVLLPNVQKPLLKIFLFNSNTMESSRNSRNLLMPLNCLPGPLRHTFDKLIGVFARPYGGNECEGRPKTEERQQGSSNLFRGRKQRERERERRRRKNIPHLHCVTAARARGSGRPAL